MTDETLKENTTHGKAPRACKQCGGGISDARMTVLYCSSNCRIDVYNGHLADVRKRMIGFLASSLRYISIRHQKISLRDLGYTPQDLADHLERQFVKGMTWGSRHKWHIDHIVPISTAETEADVIALNQLSNLRPIWAKDNLAKSDKRTHLI